MKRWSLAKLKGARKTDMHERTPPYIKERTSPGLKFCIAPLGCDVSLQTIWEGLVIPRWLCHPLK